MTAELHRIGVDIGSTTVKLVVLDKDGRIVHQRYKRHQTQTADTLTGLLREVQAAFPDHRRYAVGFTGSGAGRFSQSIGAGYIHEVLADTLAIRALTPQVSAAIELGGEDAKALYFRGTPEARMNGVCVGGTGRS